MRQIYLRYIKSQIEDNNEVVFILPYYERCENLRNSLSSNNDIFLDLQKFENERSLFL